MRDLIARVIGLKNIGFYVAPDDADITPFQIPENIELVELITDGQVMFEVNGVEKTLGKGTIFWHKSGEYTIYRTTPENPYRCAVFKFSVNDTHRPAPRVSFWNSNSQVECFTSECLELFHSRQLDDDILSLYVYGTLLRQAMAGDNILTRANYPAPLERAMAYIDKNLNKKISVDTLARSSGVSHPHLFKLFQANLHNTPHQYILSQQLLRARTMLAGTSVPVKVIARECGFENLEVFYRRFGNENGTSPGRYRREHMPYRFSKNDAL